MGLIHGTFVSLWDGGTVQSGAVYNDLTGAVDANATTCQDLGSLMEESFESYDGEVEVDVCRTCHSFAMKEGVCMDPDCESHQ